MRTDSNVEIRRREYLEDKRRIAFYSDKDSLKDFEERFKKHFPDSDESTLYNQIKMYVELYPDYEVWTPVSLCLRKSETRYIYFNYSVSNKGRVWSHYRDKEITYFVNEVSGYYTASIDGVNRYLQRLVLGSFGFDIPTELHKGILTVNHIDHIKSNNDLLNLEWMTLEDNFKDMQNHIGVTHTHYPKPVKVTLAQDIGELNKGESYYVKHRKELGTFGVHDASIRNAILKQITMYGCYFKTIPIDESITLDFEFPESLKEHFKSKVRKLKN